MRDSPHTSGSLLSRLRNPHNWEAWAHFIGVYGPLIENTLFRRGIRDADAREEITQDTLISVFKDIRTFQHDPERPGSFRAWLVSIARHRAIDYLRRMERHPRGTGKTSVQERLAQVPDHDDELDEWRRDCLRALLETAVGQVRSDFQETTWKAFWRTTRGEPAKAVAKALSMTVPAVYMAKRRVLRRLQDQIDFLEGEVT